MKKCLVLLLGLLVLPAIPSTLTAESQSGYRTTSKGTHGGTLSAPDTVEPGEAFDIEVEIDTTYLVVGFELYRDVEWYYDANNNDYVVVAGDPDPVVSFDWWFGSHEETISQTITEPGTYKYTLVVWATGGHFFDPLVGLDVYVTVADPVTPVDIDIKPTSCPNPLNVNSGGLVSVAILGSADFDVSDVDASTVTLAGVAATKWSTEDVAAPVANPTGDCDCTTAGPDGYTDLVFKFDKKALVAAIGAVDDGDEIPLKLEGELDDGGAIEGSDCVVIKKKK